MNICLFSPQEVSAQQGVLQSRDERALHIKKILHKTVGDTFTAGIIGGAGGIATIEKIGAAGSPDEGAIYFSFQEQNNGKPLYPLNMIIGFPRPIQLKRLLRDMAALGVQSVHLAGTELGEKSYLKATLSQPHEIHKMLLEGTVQAGGTHIAENFIYPSLAECLEKTAAHDCLKIALDNVAPQTSLVEFLEKNPPQEKEVFAAIGSERGWSENERALLQQRGFVRLGMGERIMRTETASTVAASLILSFMGKLK